MEVGIRELRDGLSRYLGLVRDGEELTITDRGRAIARVVPLPSERRLDRLIAEGLIDPAPDRGHRHRPRQADAAGSVSDLVAEQRR